MSEVVGLPRILLNSIQSLSELPPRALYYGSVHCRLRAVLSKCNPYENYYHCDLYDSANSKMLLSLSMTQKVWSTLLPDCQFLLKHPDFIIHIAFVGVATRHIRNNVPVVVLKEANKIIETT